MVADGAVGLGEDARAAGDLHHVVHPADVGVLTGRRAYGAVLSPEGIALAVTEIVHQSVVRGAPAAWAL